MHMCISVHFCWSRERWKMNGGKQWQLFVCLLTRKETLCKDAEIIAKGHMNCEWDSRQWRGGIEKKDIIKHDCFVYSSFPFSLTRLLSSESPVPETRAIFLCVSAFLLFISTCVSGYIYVFGQIVYCQQAANKNRRLHITLILVSLH